MAEMRTGIIHARSIANTGGVVALLLATAGIVGAQGTVLSPSAEAPDTTEPLAQTEKKPAVPSTISYVGGQLRISALDATLADVLTKVAGLTGVKIDVPDAANTDRMPIVELGPGPARQILASLLSNSRFDYLIQASDSDPEKIQSVLLVPREKRGSKTGNGPPDAVARSYGARTAAPPVKSEEAPPENPIPSPPENPLAAANGSNPQPDQALQGAPFQPQQGSSAKAPAILTPPQTLNPQSINQQLQQMYQQRAQMIQQGQTTPATANPGSK